MYAYKGKGKDFMVVCLYRKIMELVEKDVEKLLFL